MRKVDKKRKREIQEKQKIAHKRNEEKNLSKRREILFRRFIQPEVQTEVLCALSEPKKDFFEILYMTLEVTRQVKPEMVMLFFEIFPDFETYQRKRLLFKSFEEEACR